MEETRVITRYAEALAAKLAFDRPLSLRVREEIEDHLSEMVAADPAADTLAAEQRAIAAFGDPLVIAAQFATVSLARRSRNLAAAAILAIAGAYLLMKLRLGWYAAMQWAMAEDVKAVGLVIARIDGYAFLFSVAIAIGAWTYVITRPIPVNFHGTYRLELRRFFVLCVAATGALLLSVVGDATLTALRMLRAEWSVAILIPALAMTAEIAWAAILIAYVFAMRRRTASTAALLKSSDFGAPHAPN